MYSDNINVGMRVYTGAGATVYIFGEMLEFLFFKPHFIFFFFCYYI